MKTIPQIEPWINQEELRQLKRVIQSTFVVEHQLTEEFERRTRDLTGAKYALAVCNGTAALYCCLKAAGIGPGDEVIVPDLTFIASANAVIMAGAQPVFCDVREDTFCIDRACVEPVITSSTKAIMPVHLYGQSADMEGIVALARERRLVVIEDAAQGVGVRYKGKHVGTWGEMGVLSYYGNKTITCGEGGMILTNDEALRNACFRLKNHGRDRKGVFVHDAIGFNFSFTEMQAAVGIAQMKKLPKIIRKKRQIHDFYVRELAGIKDLQPVATSPKTEPVYWFTSFLIPDRDVLTNYLKQQGIQTRLFFLPLHQQPCYKDLPIGQSYPISEKIYARGLSLPSSYALSRQDQKFIISAIKKFYANRN